MSAMWSNTLKDFVHNLNDSTITIINYLCKDEIDAYLLVQALIHRLPNTVVIHSWGAVALEQTYGNCQYIERLTSEVLYAIAKHYTNSNIFLIEPIGFMEFDLKDDDIARGQHYNKLMRQLHSLLINSKSNIFLMSNVYYGANSLNNIGSYSNDMMYSAGIVFGYSDRKITILKNRFGATNITIDTKQLLVTFEREKKLKRILKLS